MRHAAPARLVAAASIAVLAASCSGGSSDGETATEASPPPVAAAPAPSPTPTPPPPVEGVVQLTAIHLEQAGQKVFPAGSPGDRPPEVDEAAVARFVGEVADLLDAQLDALNRGEEPPLPGALADSAPSADARLLTTDLADPEHLVASAAYTAEVAVDGTPRWARVELTVTHADGTAGSAELLFIATETGPELVAAGPAEEVSS